MEGAATGSFATLMGVVTDMAGAAGSPGVRLGAAVGALMRAVDASAGLLLHGGPDGMEVRPVGPAATPLDDPVATPLADPVAPEVWVVAGEHPLVDPVRAGSTAVTTAARAFGPDRWPGSAAQARVMRSWRVDQLLALPVRSGPDFVVFLLGRRGADFGQEDLELLGTLRPAISALATILEPELMPEPATRVLRLTRRESAILALLSHGHTAVRIAHLAGCSPRTVHHHLANIYAKLGVRDRLSAVNRARELGLVVAEPLAVGGVAAATPVPSAPAAP